MGVHPFGDPTVVDDFAEVPLAIDVRALHEYAARWTPAGVTFFVDGVRVREVLQSPGYPMQFMLGIYAFEEPGGHPYAQRQMTVRWFRAYRLAGQGFEEPERGIEPRTSSLPWRRSAV